ncbi:MAG: hypothetical protein JWP75_239 [Frondihabitans sp.]|nr:hypothetical protein [Frondihabitans sp.]
MNRPLTAVFAALESLLVVGIGVGIPVVALTFLWAFQYGLQVDWGVFWRAGVDVWLVGHGVDLTLTLSKSVATATGIPGAGAPILISIAALGFAVTTLLLGARSGRRLAETRHRAVGSATAIATFAVLSLVVTVSARHPLAEPSVWQGVLLPTLIFAIPLLVTAEINRRRRGAPADPLAAAALRLTSLVPRTARFVTVEAVRVASIVSAIVFAIAGLVVAFRLLTHYASIVSLYEGAHAGLLGGLALTIGQIALIPNAIAWTASWFVGPGFALGTGSSVSPLGTTIGPLPAVPFLGALPTGSPSLGFLGILVPVVAAFVATTLLRPSLQRRLGADDSIVSRIAIGVASGVVTGLIVGFVAGVSAGSAGPGRLAEIGPNGLVVGAFAALEVAVPAVLALVVAQGNLRLPSAVADRLPTRASQHPGASARSAEDQRETDVIPRLDDLDDPDRRTPDDVVTERLDGFTR